MKNYIEIDKEELPTTFEIELGAELFTFTVYYNEVGDFFSVDLADEEGNVLVNGEKVVYGEPLFFDIANHDFPAPVLIALDESGKETDVTFEHFGNTVKLVIDDD